MLPPQTDLTRAWARRLAEAVPEVRVVVAEDPDAAAREIVTAEAAFGTLRGSAGEGPAAAMAAGPAGRASGRLLL